jgi:hypothetical protein
MTISGGSIKDVSSPFRDQDAFNKAVRTLSISGKALRSYDSWKTKKLHFMLSLYEPNFQISIYPTQIAIELSSNMARLRLS